MHVDDETLSALLDDQLPSTEAAAARQHLATCEACQQRYLELEQVVSLVRCLPEVEPPRAFTLGPRALSPTPRVRRLEAWYDASRALTGALAAVFVLLLGARLYLGSTSTQPARVPLAAPAAATAPPAQTTTGAAPAPLAPQTSGARQSGPVAQPAPAARLATSPAPASDSAAAAQAPAPASAPEPVQTSSAPASSTAAGPSASPLLAAGWLAASAVVLLIAIGSTLLARYRLRQATSAWRDG